MEGFTYESGEVSGRIETYEWDNLWWEKPALADKDRVLIIGDSISCGYRGFVNELFAEAVCADGLGTSKAADSPWYEKTLAYMASQRADYRLVQFNNGLHGWHLTDEGGYRDGCRALLLRIRALFPRAALVIALTTPARDKENLSRFSARNERVLARNASLRALALELGVPVLDLYEPLEKRPELFRDDGVHLLEEGYRVLAARCASCYRELLGAEEGKA